MRVLKSIGFGNRAFLLLAMTAMCPTGAQAGYVSGQVVMGGVSFKPSEIAAFRDRKGGDPHKFLTYLVLTVQPVNADKIRQSLDPSNAVRDDPAGAGDKIFAYVLADGTIQVNARVNNDAYDGEAYPPDSKGVPGELLGTCEANTTTHVACSVKTRKPSKSRDGQDCTLELTFDADVLAPPAGLPLAQDGGEPGTALRELYAAVAGDKIDPILARLLPKNLVREYAAAYALEMLHDHDLSPERTLKDLKDRLGSFLPKQPRITGGERRGDDYALVELEETKAFAGKPRRFLYLVEMRRVDGTWRFVKATSVGMFR